MSKLFAIAMPVLPGKTEQVKKLANEAKTRYQKEFNESRKSLGVQERTFLQTGPKGDIVIVTLEGENPQEAFAKFAQKNDEFTKWFTNMVKEVHGIDLSQPPSGPLPELLLESEPISESILK